MFRRLMALPMPALLGIFAVAGLLAAILGLVARLWLAPLVRNVVEAQQAAAAGPVAAEANPPPPEPPKNDPPKPTLAELQAARIELLDKLIGLGVFKDFERERGCVVTVGPAFRHLDPADRQAFVSVYFAWRYQTTPDDEDPYKWIPQLDSREVFVIDPGEPPVLGRFGRMWGGLKMDYPPGQDEWR